LRAKVDPEDVLQEVSCRAWRRFDTFDPERGSFLAWSLGIARNVMGEALTRLARGDGVGSQWSTGSWSQVPDDATRATGKVARDEQLAAFVTWVDELDRDERRLVLYRVLEGWSHAEVAGVLGISEEAASKRWDRFRARLQSQPRALEWLNGSQESSS